MRLRLQLLQISRGFAALLVILFHLRDTSITYFKTKAFGDFFSFGNSGVIYFFVLSGFIITYTHYSDLKCRTNAFKFLKKRFIRIYPMYWVVATITLVVLIFVLHGNSPHLDHTLDIKSPSEWHYIVSCYLLLPIKYEYFLQLSWTLSYEVFFYFLFFIAIILGYGRAKWMVGIWLFLIIVGQTIWRSPHNTAITTLLSSLNMVFITGCLIAHLFKTSVRIPWWISVSILVIIFVIYYFEQYFFLLGLQKSFLNLLLQTILFGIILYNIVEIDITRKINGSNLLLTVGEASYSIYLTHPIFLGIFGRLFSKYLPLLNISNIFYVHIILIIVFLLVIFCGILCFRYLEKPLMNFLNKKPAQE